MTARDLPRPLPECARCHDPMRRRTWAAAAGVCARCQTKPERLATAQRAARLATARTRSTASTDDRINRLAAKRAARTTQETRPA